MVEALSVGAKLVGPFTKAVRFYSYRKTRGSVLDEALHDALEVALSSVVGQGHCVDMRLPARNLLRVLYATDVPGERSILSRGDRVMRWGREVFSKRFPRLELLGHQAFEERLRRWVSRALLSDDGKKVLDEAGLSSLTSEKDIDRIARLTEQEFLHQVVRFNGEGGFEDRVRTGLVKDLETLYNNPATALSQRSTRPWAMSSAVGAASGAVAGFVTDVTTQLQNVEAIGVGAAFAVVTTLGVEILRRRRTLTGPQFEARRAVLGWLSALLDRLFHLPPVAPTVQDVTASVERAFGRFEGISAARPPDLRGIPPSTNHESFVLPERNRLRELIELTGAVHDHEVQAALIALDSVAWSGSSQSTLFHSLRKLLRALSS